MAALAVRGVGLSAALAVAAVVLTPFIDGRPNGSSKAGMSLHLDAPVEAPWCAHVDGFAAKSCGYSTFEQCLKAVGPAYGTCRPNPAAVVVDDVPYWKYRSVYL